MHCNMHKVQRQKSGHHFSLAGQSKLKLALLLTCD